MARNKLNRRVFLRNGLAAGAAVGLGLSRMTAKSHARVLGANDRINLALIGCGGRGQWLTQSAVKATDTNAALVAICDIWKKRLETYPSQAETAFGRKPKAYADYHKVLDDADVDAVIIATPDHQHIGQALDAVQAGKHVYVEKPLPGRACDLPDMNRYYDIVKACKLAVQHGTQGMTSPAARAIKQFIAEKKLGKLFRVESTETAPAPYWVHYSGPKTEAETDWKAFLYNRKDRPFDAHLHACWMGYWDITNGTIGGWMSHFINTVHFVTGSAAPVAGAAWGGRYASTNDKRCDAPDQIVVCLEYAEGFHTQFVTHFGSAINNDTTIFFFEKGSLKTRFGHDLGNPVYSSEGVDDAIKPTKLLDVDPPYPGNDHVRNWCDCIRSGAQPNANVEYGYKHGIAVILGDVAYETGRKAVFDREKREVRPL